MGGGLGEIRGDLDFFEEGRGLLFLFSGFYCLFGIFGVKRGSY